MEKFIELKALIENASGKKIKILRSDNGGEYISNDFLCICSQSGIHIQHSVPYTPQQNGVAERKNRSLKEMTSCMMESKKLAENLWDEAMNAVEYIQNIFPHSSMKGNTPLGKYMQEIITDIFPTIIRSQNLDLFSRCILNQGLQFSEFFQDFRLLFDKKDPCVSGKVIHEIQNVS